MAELRGIPPVEATYEASLPAMAAMREAIETLQGLRDPALAALTRAEAMRLGLIPSITFYSSGAFLLGVLIGVLL